MGAQNRPSSDGRLDAQFIDGSAGALFANAGFWDGDIDIMQIDVVWAGILANHLIDLKPYVGDTPEEHFPALIENNTVDGRLVAMPWWADVGVLYYRKDLLEKHGFAPRRRGRK